MKKKYRGKTQMKKFDKIVAAAVSETQTEASWGALAFWQAVLLTKTGDYLLATVDNCLAGDATEGEIVSISTKPAEKLISLGG